MKYDNIVEEVHSLRGRVKHLEVEMQGMRLFSQGFVGQAPSLVFLSTAEQRTLQVLKTFEKPAIAQEVAAKTGRARAIESMHLNHLFRQNMLLKGRWGRKQYFLLKEEYRVGDLPDSK